MFPIYAYTYQFSQYSIQYVTHLWCTLFIEHTGNQENPQARQRQENFNYTLYPVIQTQTSILSKLALATRYKSSTADPKQYFNSISIPLSSFAQNYETKQQQNDSRQAVLWFAYTIHNIQCFRIFRHTLFTLLEFKDGQCSLHVLTLHFLSTGAACIIFIIFIILILAHCATLVLAKLGQVDL